MGIHWAAAFVRVETLAEQVTPADVLGPEEMGQFVGILEGRKIDRQQHDGDQPV